MNHIELFAFLKNKKISKLENIKPNFNLRHVDKFTKLKHTQQITMVFIISKFPFKKIVIFEANRFRIFTNGYRHEH